MFKTNLADTIGLSRYLETYKFTDLLATRSLHCQRLGLFRDNMEGRLTAADQTAERGELWARAQQPPLSQGELYSALDVLEANRMTSRLASNFVVCWYGAVDESSKMWRAYCPNGGVLLRTSVGKLKAALGAADNSVAADNLKAIEQVVSQIGFDKVPNYKEMMQCMDDAQNTLGLAPIEYRDWSQGGVVADRKPIQFIKDESFADEREIRLLAIRLPSPTLVNPLEDSIRLNLDIRLLIDEIVLYPGAPASFADEVKNHVAKAGILADVIPSALCVP